MLDAAWNIRGANTVAPVLVAAVHDDGVWLYARTSEPVGPIPPAQAARRIQSVLDEPDSISAFHQMQSILRTLATPGGGGFTNILNCLTSK